MEKHFKFSYVITHRETTISRKENLNFILTWVSSLKLNIEIVLVEQDDSPKVDIRSLPCCCKYVFAFNDGLFNRGWGLNVGFRHASGNSAIAFADNDVVVDKGILAEVFNLFSGENEYDAIKPFNKLVDLTKEESESILKGSHSFADLELENRKPRLGISFGSAFTVFSVHAYERIGGFDERFVGWGGEDDAMSKFKIPLLKNAYISEDEAYHLWHERSHNDCNLQPNYLNNVKLLHEYQNYTKRDLLLLCKESKHNFGKLNKNKSERSIPKKVIIGLGTGRCGTMSLANLLSSQSGVIVPHEYQALPLPWDFSQTALERKIESLRYINGDVGFYYLNYVEQIVDIFPQVRFVCLKRNKNEVVESYMKKTRGRNHWMNHDGKNWKNDSKWDSAYPKFNVSGKSSAIAMYYDMYYKKITYLKRKYPNKIRVFEIDCLNNEKGIRDILSFCGFAEEEMYITQKKFINRI